MTTHFIYNTNDFYCISNSLFKNDYFSVLFIVLMSFALYPVFRFFIKYYFF